MCRLLGITNFDHKKHQDIIEDFCRLVERGNVLAGDPPGHRDGWGVGYYRYGKAHLVKSGGDLLKEKKAFDRLVAEISASKVLIVHLRKSAWPETSTREHAHPFLFGNCLFAHNGTVRDYRKLLSIIPKGGLRPSALDTEVFFHFILSFGGDPGDAFREAVRHIKANNTFSALNSLLTDGKHLYAYRDYAKHPGYYSLYSAKRGRSSMIASEPLAQGLEWKMMPKGQFLAL